MAKNKTCEGRSGLVTKEVGKLRIVVKDKESREDFGKDYYMRRAGSRIK